MFINTRTMTECEQKKKKTNLRKNQMPIKIKRNLYQIHWIIHDLNDFAAFFYLKLEFSGSKIFSFGKLLMKYNIQHPFRLNIIISIPFHCNAMLSHAFI